MSRYNKERNFLNILNEKICDDPYSDFDAFLISKGIKIPDNTLINQALKEELDKFNTENKEAISDSNRKATELL